MITDWESLAQALRDELQEHGALLNLFEEQQAAILERKPDLVLHMVEAINKQVATIRDVHKRRKASVCFVAQEVQCPESTPLSELITYFPGPSWPLLRALVSEVNRLVRQTKRRARQNQMLLARTIEVSQEILQRLNPGSVIRTYSPEGRAEVGATAAQGRVVARI